MGTIPPDHVCIQTSATSIDKAIPIEQFTDMTLEVSTLLLESGAHCERIFRNVQRIARDTDFDVEIFLSFTAISISVTDKKNPKSSLTKNKRIKHHSAHFGILTDTSLLTWKVIEKEISLSELKHSLDKLKESSKYPIWLVRLFIGIACGCLCLLAGGNWIDGVFTLSASIAGLTIRQEMIKRSFNLMISIVCSAFITTTISGLNSLYGLGKCPESSVATAVLFLIPGVPLINSIIDLLEGYIPTGIARGAFGGFILLCIAVGMFLSITLIGINNF